MDSLRSSSLSFFETGVCGSARHGSGVGSPGEVVPGAGRGDASTTTALCGLSRRRRLARSPARAPARRGPGPAGRRKYLNSGCLAIRPIAGFVK